MKVTVTYEANLPDEDEVYEMLANFTAFLPFESKKFVLYIIDDNIHTIKLQDLVQAHAVCKENLQRLEKVKVETEHLLDLKEKAYNQLDIICNMLCFAINKNTGGPWG